MKKIKDIFEVKYGHSYELCNMQPGKIPFVSRTEKNNGISGFVTKTTDEPTPAGVLSVALGGSVLATFLQPTPCYEGRDVETLVARGSMTPQEKLWYAIAIRANKYKYNYGRQANKELKHIHIPAPPAWVNTIPIPDYSHLKNAKSEEEVELKDWKNFDIHELFKISRQQGPSVEWVEENPGEIPFVSATKFNNGISGHCIETKEYQKVKGGCLTIQANGTDIGTCFLQKEDFYITGDVVTATPRVQISNEGLIYCATLISNNIYKFNYGRKFNGVRTHIKISLPTKTGLPDWDGITRFIQSCKFSATI